MGPVGVLSDALPGGRQPGLKTVAFRSAKGHPFAERKATNAPTTRRSCLYRRGVRLVPRRRCPSHPTAPARVLPPAPRTLGGALGPERDRQRHDGDHHRRRRPRRLQHPARPERATKKLLLGQTVFVPPAGVPQSTLASGRGLNWYFTALATNITGRRNSEQPNRAAQKLAQPGRRKAGYPPWPSFFFPASGVERGAVSELTGEETSR